MTTSRQFSVAALSRAWLPLSLLLLTFVVIVMAVRPTSPEVVSMPASWLLGMPVSSEMKEAGPSLAEQLTAISHYVEVEGEPKLLNDVFILLPALIMLWLALLLSHASILWENYKQERHSRSSTRVHSSFSLLQSAFKNSQFRAPTYIVFLPLTVLMVLTFDGYLKFHEAESKITPELKEEPTEPAKTKVENKQYQESEYTVKPFKEVEAPKQSINTEQPDNIFIVRISDGQDAVIKQKYSDGSSQRRMAYSVVDLASGEELAHGILKMSEDNIDGRFEQHKYGWLAKNGNYYFTGRSFHSMLAFDPKNYSIKFIKRSEFLAQFPIVEEISSIKLSNHPSGDYIKSVTDFFVSATTIKGVRHHICLHDFSLKNKQPEKVKKQETERQVFMFSHEFVTDKVANSAWKKVYLAPVKNKSIFRVGMITDEMRSYVSESPAQLLHPKTLGWSPSGVLIVSKTDLSDQYKKTLTFINGENQVAWQWDDALSTLLAELVGSHLDSDKYRLRVSYEDEHFIINVYFDRFKHIAMASVHHETGNIKWRYLF